MNRNKLINVWKGFKTIMRIYLLSSLFQGARLHFAGIITLTILLIAKYSSMYNVNDVHVDTYR